MEHVLSCYATSWPVVKSAILSLHLCETFNMQVLILYDHCSIRRSSMHRTRILFNSWKKFRETLGKWHVICAYSMRTSRDDHRFIIITCFKFSTGILKWMKVWNIENYIILWIDSFPNESWKLEIIKVSKDPDILIWKFFYF